MLRAWHSLETRFTMDIDVWGKSSNEIDSVDQDF